MNKYELIDQIHDAERINKGDYLAKAGRVEGGWQYYLIADTLRDLIAAAEAARADGVEVDGVVYESLTDCDDESPDSRVIDYRL